jgi:hypothetical protein
MQALKAVAGFRSLKTVIATASSARVLNLHALDLESPDDPDYAERPMFTHPVLNRAIIIKHNLHPSEAERRPNKRFNATKVIFPFDPADLNLGGQWLLVGQRNFLGALSRHLDYTDLPMDRDMAVLRILDKLPTLDPFLVRESLNQKKIDVGLCYYRFTKRDKAEMLGFVAGEIEALVRLCFGDAAANKERTERLSQLLLANQESAELEPLRETFRMKASEFSEAMFSWKAFLYYHWRSRALAPAIEATLTSISAIRAGRHERDELAFVARAKRLVGKSVALSWREIKQRLELYDTAFAALTDQRNPDQFRTFLANSSNQFLELGDRIGRLEQVVSFWGHRFGGKSMSRRSTDSVVDGMRDLLQALSLEIADRPSAPTVPLGLQTPSAPRLPPASEIAPLSRSAAVS